MIIREEINNGFIKDEIKISDYVFGAGNIDGNILRPDGDWRDYCPKYELQRQNGLETMNCATFHTLNPIEIIFEEQYGILDSDFSERYTGTLAETSRAGNSPHKVAEAIRKRGLVPEEMLPFSSEINTWEEYYAPIDSRLLKEGKQWLTEWDFGHDWVFLDHMTLGEKHERLKNALKYSPLGVSVHAWVSEDDVYFKQGEADNHWCTLVYADDEYWYVFDTYEPFLKKLRKDYDFGIAKRYTINRNPKRPNWVVDLWRRIIS